MDLAPTVDQETFRAECRQWLKGNLPWEYGQGLPPLFDDLGKEVDFLRGWQSALAEARLVGVSWPEEYGGRGAGPLHHYIVQEELARARAPELVGRIGVNLIGPTVLAHGTPDQKQRWLPSILPAEQLFCQLFSEPDAGSDLASLSTQAVPAEGGWRLSGQKVWTSYAQFADWGLCLARSHPDEPKHRGITAFMVDMHAPGVDIRPLRQITDESDFNEVFLNDVLVTHDQVIGNPGNGWRVSQSTLGAASADWIRKMFVTPTEPSWASKPLWRGSGKEIRSLPMWTMIASHSKLNLTLTPNCRRRCCRDFEQNRNRPPARAGKPSARHGHRRSRRGLKTAPRMLLGEPSRPSVAHYG